MSDVLFACSKCYSRHPFEELSTGQQLCKECRGSYPVVKCTYCRSEFQQPSKSNTTAICKKCETNVKIYGRPTACEYCNIIAAFIGNKCQRCTNSEKRYGAPVTCEQCKQKCAFDRHDEEKKVDGKLLCWLCTLSYKRALAKTKSDPTRHSHVKLGSDKEKRKIEVKKIIDKKPQRVDVTKLNEFDAPTPPKQSRPAEPEQRDHVVRETQLKEKIANLERQLAQKEKELLAKDRLITEIRADSSSKEMDARNKLKQLQREHEQKIETLNQKLKAQQKEIAAKTRANNSAKNQKQAPPPPPKESTPPPTQKSSLTIVKKEESSSGSSSSSSSSSSPHSD